MKTYVIVDGYSINDKTKWQSAITPIEEPVRIVIVHNYVEEIITESIKLKEYLSDATLGRDYIIRP